MLPPHCGQTQLMIEEMMLASGSSAVVSVMLIVSPLRPGQVGGDARRSQRPRTTDNLPRMSFALKRSVLVGCGGRLGPRVKAAASLVQGHASAMPNAKCKIRQRLTPQILDTHARSRWRDLHDRKSSYATPVNPMLAGCNVSLTAN